ncbi:unnamed protein product [marine sediment metagenome]|uniref:Methyltransferase type 11 domain-containing protein n=1 Tax=marine sediment metagenome TaxID=412755 RepID=X1ARF7_9ZZZZ
MKANDYIIGHWERKKIWKNNQRPHHRKRLNMIAQSVKGKKFLDVGCCFGHSTNDLKRLHPGDWSGLDFSEYAAKKAHHLFPELTFYFAENFKLLPVCGQFDSVVCSEVLEHVEEDQELVKGLLEITKDVLFMTTPHCFVNDPGHIRVYDEAMLADLFKGMQYKIQKDGLFFYITVSKNERLI